MLFLPVTQEVKDKIEIVAVTRIEELLEAAGVLEPAAGTRELSNAR